MIIYFQFKAQPCFHSNKLIHPLWRTMALVRVQPSSTDSPLNSTESLLLPIIQTSDPHPHQHTHLCSDKNRTRPRNSFSGINIRVKSRGFQNLAIIFLTVIIINNRHLRFDILAIDCIRNDRITD